MADEEKTESEPVKDVEEATPTKPEDTTPAPEAVPPTANTDADKDLRSIVEGLSETVQGLAETVNTIVAKASPDSRPVKRPWTHWGS